MVKSLSITEVETVFADVVNWVPLWANFDYEKALSGYVAAYPHRLEDGLRPYPLERTKERKGKGRTRMDVLLIDEAGTPVVVECKQNAPTVAHIKQLRSYMRQVRADTHIPPRGILVHGGARKLKDLVRRAANAKPRVQLVQHRLEVGFAPSA